MLRPVVMTDRFVFVCYFDFFTREFDILYLYLNSTYLCTNSTCYVNFYAKNSRTCTQRKNYAISLSRKSHNSCPISSGAMRNETSFISFSILYSSPAHRIEINRRATRVGRSAIILASQLHKNRETCCTAEWPFCLCLFCAPQKGLKNYVFCA